MVVNKNKKTTKKASAFIKDKNTLVSEIKESWSRINSFNVMQKGVVAPFDVKAVYKKINALEARLVAAKVSVLAINMGFSKIDDLPDECVFPTIFTLSQIKERIVKLNLIPTKVNDHSDTIALTKDFVDSEIKILTAAKIEAEKDLEDFNETSEFEEN